MEYRLSQDSLELISNLLNGAVENNEEAIREYGGPDADAELDGLDKADFDNLVETQADYDSALNACANNKFSLDDLGTAMDILDTTYQNNRDLLGEDPDDEEDAELRVQTNQIITAMDEVNKKIESA